MTDEEAVEMLRRAVTSACGNIADEHERGDGVLRRVLREHGFPQLARLHADLADERPWWFA